MSPRAKLQRVTCWLLAGLGGLMALAAIATGLVYMARTTPDSTLIEATGRGDIDFRVFYYNNELFPDNPVPKNLYFLRHFTDFIEIDSSFMLWFNGNRTFDVDFNYTAEKRFEISYLGGQPGHNPVVFQQNTEISQVSGAVSGNNMSFRPYSGPDWPGGTYTIRLQEYMQVFDNFLEYNEQRLDDNANLRGFSAELVIEFSLQLTAWEAGLNETIRRSYRIPIGINVFSLEAMGNAGFTSSTLVVHDADGVSLTMMGGLGFAVIIGGLGLITGIKKLSVRPDQDPSQQEYHAIMKKYGNEIVSSKGLSDLSGFMVTPVESFEELLKLSLNTGKMIVSHNQGDKAVFYVITDNIAFQFEIVFFDTTATPIKKSQTSHKFREKGAVS